MPLTCPRDAAELTLGKEHGIEVDRCPACKGAWYDNEELAALESTMADDDDRRGMIEYAKRQSDLACPVCQATMRAFNYRAYNLELDACEKEHGFWLDAGESDRVREVVKDRVDGLRRGDSAQVQWNKLKGRGGGGVIDSLRGMFGGRRR